MLVLVLVLEIETIGEDGRGGDEEVEEEEVGMDVWEGKMRSVWWRGGSIVIRGQTGGKITSTLFSQAFIFIFLRT